MLECQALWLCPATASQNLQHSPRWLIHEAGSRRFLGLARLRVQSVSVWFGSWRRPTLEVYETEDESLLFMLARGWGQGWLVSDAEGQRVGSLRGSTVRDGTGQRIATLTASGANGTDTWQTDDGQELATATTDGPGVVLRFAPQLEGQPFLKMLLLATVLRAGA